MNSSLLKKILPHAIAIVVFLIVALVYCKPSLDGKVLNQSDIIGHTGMAKQSIDFNEKHGHYPLWTESAFSGMPTYTILLPSSSTILDKLVFFLYSFNPIILFFFACLCFYVLAQVLRMNVWLAVLSSLAFTYTSFDPIILAVGHVTQMVAIAFMPLVIAGFLLILKRKYIAGAAMFSISLGMQASVSQHIQVIYYTGIMIGFIAIAFVIKSWREKQMRNAGYAVALVAVCSILGFAMDAVAFLPLQEYAKETMRGGKSELKDSQEGNKTKGGLDKDYAFQWSYGIGETSTLIVPGAQGGGYLNRNLVDNSKFTEKLGELGLPENSALQFTAIYGYWGPQHDTAGPVYLGAVICFLFVFGLVYAKSWHKWWILPVTIFAILLAWGKNFSGFNYFLFDYMPFYNKFRAPTMSLIRPQLTVPLLAALGLNQLIANPGSKEETWKKFKSSVLITGAILLLVAAYYFMADYKGPRDINLKEQFTSGMLQQAARGKQPTPEMQQQVNDMVNSIVKDLQSDRQSLFGSDLLRSFLFVALAVVVLGLYLKGKIKPVVLFAGLTILSSYDLLAEGRKYLNEDSFVEPADIDAAFRPSSADEKINSDPDKNFRVLDQSADAFQDSHASYFHNSVGGYSPAKLGLYQDIIENQLSKGNLRVYDMLNTKYFIRRNPQGTDDEAILNPNAYGTCWLVKNIHYVNDANEEMKALDSINVRDTAIVRKSFENQIKLVPVPDSTASIRLVENLNDKVTYKYSAKSNQFAIFSEVYYDKGWNAYLDGTKTPYYRVDYVLRGMPLPPGDHNIEFRFEPKSFSNGEKITWAAHIIGYILLFAAIGVELRNERRKKPTENNIEKK